MIERPLLPWLFVLWLGALPLSRLEAGGESPSQVLGESEIAEMQKRVAAGGRALEVGDLDGAAQAFGAARDLDPRASLPWLGLAEVAERRGDPIEALRAAQQALELSPGDIPALKLISRLQIGLGAPVEALASLEKWRRLEPQDPLPYQTAAVVLRDIDRGEEAIALLRDAVTREAESPALIGQLGLLLIEKGGAAEALEIVQPRLDRWPESADLELVSGLALLADPERRGEAVPWLERALEHGAPGKGKIHLALGEAMLDGCNEAAVDHFRRAVELLPQLPEAHYKLATGLRACGDGDGARAALGRFRELSQSADGADHQRRRLGTALNEVQELAAAGDLTAALARLDELVEQNPGDDRIFTLRGKLLFSAGRPEEALASVKRAQKLMPSRVEGHYLEGLFLSQGGDLEGGRGALERALAIDPNRLEALKLLAAVEAELGRLELSAGLFERALTLGSDPLVHLAYGRVLKALGRDAESEEQMAKYRQLSEK